MLTNFLSTRPGMLIAGMSMLTLAGQIIALVFPAEFAQFCTSYKDFL